MLHFKNDDERRLFAIEVEGFDQRYDAAVRMCRAYRGKNGYHSRLSDCTVHPIRDSFDYAYALLCRNNKGDRERAYDLLYRTLPLQDINPARDTYGIWQYFLEEDLEEMNPPDWNWADFNGKTLLQMLSEHDDKLTDDLKARMRDAVCHACRAIIKRDVQPDYTNISIMGAYVTLFAGELLENEDFFRYGKARLAKLHQYNLSRENFSEFNSPTYTFVCLEDLSHLQQTVHDEDCRRMAHELSDLAWRTVALHFHPATGQLAGPHDRAYAFLLSDSTKLSLERALDYRVRLLASHDTFTPDNLGCGHFTTPLQCPACYLPYFVGTADQERILDQTFAPGRMAYTYMRKEFTLGSLHMECAWNQHRNVLGYLGSVDEPIALNVKCLHDGWDFCSGWMATVQDRGQLLTAMGFVTNGGDTHVCLDMVQNATISARDLRVRCLLEGAVSHLSLTREDERTFRLTDRRSGVTLRIAFPYAVFGEHPVQYTLSREEDCLCIDVVLVSTPQAQPVCISALSQALIVTQLQLATAEQDAPLPAARTQEDRDALYIEAGALALSFPKQPSSRASLSQRIRLWRDGVPYQPAQ